MLINEDKWKEVEFVHLRTFIAVAALGNFSRAAEQLGLTQPCISQQIHKLEETLGVPLFVRSGRRATLTRSGEYLLGQAQDLIRLMHNACQETSHIGGKKGTHLRIGVVPICSATFMPLIMGRFLKKFPDCQLAIEEVSASEIEAKVESGHFDLGIGFLPHASPKLRYQPLVREKFILIVNQDHPLAKRKEIAVTELSDHPLVLLPSNYFMRHHLDQIFRSNRIVPRVQIEINSATAIIRTVVASALASLMPPFSISFGLYPQLRGLDLIGKQPFVELGIIHPPKDEEKSNHAAIESFCQISLEVLRPAK